MEAVFPTWETILSPSNVLGCFLALIGLYLLGHLITFIQYLVAIGKIPGAPAASWLLGHTQYYKFITSGHVSPGEGN